MIIANSILPASIGLYISNIIANLMQPQKILVIKRTNSRLQNILIYPFELQDEKKGSCTSALHAIVYSIGSKIIRALEIICVKKLISNAIL